MTGGSSALEEDAHRDLSQIPPLQVDQDFLGAVDNTQCLDLKLTPSGARIVLPDGKFKNVSLKSLAKAIFDDTGIDTQYMPLLGSSYTGIRRYIQSGDKHIILLEASPTKRMIRYDRGYCDNDWVNRRINEGMIQPNDIDNTIEFKDIPFPTILMGITLRETPEGRLKHRTSRLFASKVPVFSDNTRLYKFPYGNIYSDQRVCWGDMNDQVTRETYNNILQAGGLLDQFLMTIYNSDLHDRDRTHMTSESRPERLFLDLQDNHEEYPYSTLQESLTVAELISLLKNN